MWKLSVVSLSIPHSFSLFLSAFCISTVSLPSVFSYVFPLSSSPVSCRLSLIVPVLYLSLCLFLWLWPLCLPFYHFPYVSLPVFPDVLFRLIPIVIVSPSLSLPHIYLLHSLPLCLPTSFSLYLLYPYISLLLMSLRPVFSTQCFPSVSLHITLYLSHSLFPLNFSRFGSPLMSLPPLYVFSLLTLSPRLCPPLSLSLSLFLSVFFFPYVSHPMSLYEN